MVSRTINYDPASNCLTEIYQQGVNKILRSTACLLFLRPLESSGDLKDEPNSSLLPLPLLYPLITQVLGVNKYKNGRGICLDVIRV